jgi:Fe2+ or Zn2+ uptake regulation protein
MKLTQRRLEELIQAHGLKMTPQRRAIVECLESALHHPTADEIYTVVNQRFPMTSRATVYNTLNLLKEAQLVQEIFENGVSRFDPNLSHHHHFICRRCGTVEDIEESMIGLPPPSTFGQNKTIETVEMTFRGLCERCTSSQERYTPSQN